MQLFLTDWQIDDILELLPDCDFVLEDALSRLDISIDLDRAVALLEKAVKPSFFLEQSGKFFQGEFNE